MAKLYPPNIAGTLPSFYIPSAGTTTLVVPFSMNKTVSPNQVKGFSLRIKTTNTDILYGVLESDNWNKAEAVNPQVSFIVPDRILNKLVIGQFYKVQLAYIDLDGIIGYYSTVGIMKFTSQPRVEISGFNLSITNLNRTEYVGVYHNMDDPSEKAYQYCFNLYDRSNNLLESSGWKLHNSYEDTSLTETMDRYVLKYAIQEDIVYRIRYSVITNNNLQVNSPAYLVMNSKSIDPELRAKLRATLDYNNACIDLELIGEKDPNTGKEYAASGSFLLTRASSLDNYSSWMTISNFKLTGELPSAFLFRDYTIEQGATYIYSLQQYNDYGIYSNRLLTDYIEGQFEDAYLFDGKRQLKIRFNPKISSFKTTVLESKKNTIGGKYPFIFRNGAVEYKEFPINGLITYMMDNDEFFLSLSKDLHIQDWEYTTDITDENVMVERLFKLEVLKWLNDGNIKLFKSPQEGNYIVRLMNVSMTPIDTVSRMLHNFQCQASEIADYTSENLAKYGLINVDDLITYQMRWETIILSDYYKTNGNKIYDIDLLRGYGAYHIKFTDMIQGTMFQFTDSIGVVHEIMIGATGAYEVQLDQPVYNLKLLSTNNTGYTNPNFLQGSVTFSIMSAAQNIFDTITSIVTKDIPVHQVFGPDDNILSYYTNIRREVSRIYFARFSKLEVREVYSPLFGTEVFDDNLQAYKLTGVISTLIPTPDKSMTNNIYAYDIPTIDTNGQVVHNYYRYWQGKLYELPHFSTVLPSLNNTSYDTSKDNKSYIPILDAYTLYKDGDNYYRLIGNQLVLNKDEWLAEAINGTRYNINYTDLVPYVIYLKKYYRGSELIEEYYKYNGYELILLDEYSTLIDYDGVSFDVADKEVLYIQELDYVPKYISIGAGVGAELGLQVKLIEYNVERQCQEEQEAYLAAFMDYNAASVRLTEISHEDAAKNPDGVYFIWRDNNFYALQDYELEEYLARDITFYRPQELSEYISQKELDIKYQAVLDTEAIYIQAIQEMLDAEKEGGIG